MANCMLCWPNIAVEATLSGGSWAPTLPLDNMKTSVLAKVARTTDLYESSTQWSVTLSSPTYINMLALTRHNFSKGATMQVDVWGDVDQTNLLYSTGLQSVWPRLTSSLSRSWEDPDFWLGQASESTIENFNKVWLHVFPSKQYVKKITFQAHDTGNPFPYLQIGNMFMSLGWLPFVNLSYSSTFQYMDTSTIKYSQNGTEQTNKKTKYRVVVGKLGLLTDEEAANQVLAMQGDRGITEDIFFVWDYEDTTLSMQKSFLARLETLTPIEVFNFRANRNDIQLKERT